MDDHLSPAAHALGRRLRLGYAVILLVLALGLGWAGAQLTGLLGLDAYHAGMLNAAGRQRFLSVRSVHHALIAARHPDKITIRAAASASTSPSAPTSPQSSSPSSAWPPRRRGRERARIGCARYPTAFPS